jgi:hypothetical protein
LESRYGLVSQVISLQADANTTLQFLSADCRGLGHESTLSDR